MEKQCGKGARCGGGGTEAEWMGDEEEVSLAEMRARQRGRHRAAAAALPPATPDRVLPLHQGMMGATVAASLPLAGGGVPVNVAGGHVRSGSGSGGSTGTFWGGLSRLSSSGSGG